MTGKTSFTASLIAIFLLIPLLSQAAPVDSLYYGKLQKDLEKATFAADSILILNNMFDLVSQPRSLRNSIGNRIIDVANRSGKPDVTFDAIRRLVNYNYGSEKYIDSMQAVVEKYPQSSDRDITVAFIRMLRNSYALKSLNDSVKTEYISRLSDEFASTPPESTLDQIVKLHALCVLLGDSYQSNLISRYMQRLGTLIDGLPDEALSLKNLFYVQAAITYVQCDMRPEAITADRKLLQIIGELETNYKLQGRQFINYDANKYIIYTRLLSSYPHLQQPEIEKYYSAIKEIIKTDIRAANTYKRRPEAEVYYALSKGDNATAVKLLPEIVNNTTDSWGQRRFLKLLIDAARATGNKDVLLSALDQYTTLTDNLMQHHISSLYREMKIAYDMYELESEYKSLAAEKADSDRRRTRWVYTAIAIIAVILLIAVVVFGIIFRRTRSLARRLELTNNDLTSERDQLRKQQDALREAREEAEKANALRAHFIKNLSSEIVPPLNAITEYAHLLTDLIDEHTRQYMEHYVGMIEQNCELLRTLSQDIMLLSEIDTTRLPINLTNVDVERTLNAAIESSQSLNRKNLEVSLVNSGIDFPIHSDPQRVQQIISYLLSNAYKFTDEGSVTVRAYRSGKNLAISVTDTGMGINHKFKDKIFDRFFKISRDTPGAGLGLHIARNLARLLGGDLKFDASYERGARFILVLPIN